MVGVRVIPETQIGASILVVDSFDRDFIFGEGKSFLFRFLFFSFSFLINNHYIKIKLKKIKKKMKQFTDINITT